MPYKQDEFGVWWYHNSKQRMKVGEYQCQKCNKMFHRVKCNVNKKHYCSVQCSNKTNAIQQSINRKGIGNPMWKGGRKKVGGGYVKVYKPEHPNCDKKHCILEHRLVMESKIGRYLYPFETVHHKNGIRDDNRIENLQLFVSHHPAGQTPEDLLVWAKEIICIYG